MEEIIKYFEDYKFKDTFDIYKTYDELMLLNDLQLSELFNINNEEISIKDTLKYYFQDILKDIIKNPRSKCFKRMIEYRKDFNYFPDINEINKQ